VVTFNAGIGDYQQSGALAYFGSDETVAGEAAGKKASDEGAKHVLCVIHAQGQIQLEARCSGVQKTFNGQYTKVYVNGTDMPSVRTTIAAKLKQDPSIDFIVLLDAPVALTAISAVSDAGSKARIGTFDFNPQIPPKIKDGQLAFAIDALWLYKTNGNVLGGGKPTLTGPYLVDKSNVDFVAKFAEGGTR
jgi:simple sugar transport system substrate-binding protein